MRFAYLANRIAERHELATGPVDTEWLLDSAADHEPVVFVDHETPGSQRLRDAGITVHTSPKRDSRLPGGATISADHLQATLLAREREENGVDLIIQDSTQTSDPAWFVPALQDVPRAVALGPGLVASQQAILDDASLFQFFGRDLWSTTGFIASADFLLTDIDPSGFGFRTDGLPPARSAGRPAASTASDSTEPAGPTEPTSMVAVVATHETAAGLATLLPRVTARIPVEEGTTIVVVPADLRIGPETTRRLVLDGCPPHLEKSVIVSTPGDDGVAAAFLEAADIVVAAGPGDLAVPAVAVAAEPLVLLTDPVPAPDTAWSDDLPARRPPAGAILIPIEEEPADAVELLDRLEDDPAAAAVVLHTPEMSAEAFRLVDFFPETGVDLAVLAQPEHQYGAPQPGVPCTKVLAASRQTWPSLRRRLRTAHSVDELVVWCLGLSLTENVRLLVLPGSGAGCSPLPVEDVGGLPAWITSTGILPRPNLAGVNAVTGTGTSETGPASIREWAESASWRQRAPLVLPWRWGLLDRIMKDRW
jgi:hypothetical protein